MKPVTWLPAVATLGLLLATVTPAATADDTTNSPNAYSAEGDGSSISLNGYSQSTQVSAGSGSAEGTYGQASSSDVVVRPFVRCNPNLTADAYYTAGPNTKILGSLCRPAATVPAADSPGQVVTLSAQDVSTLLVEGSGLYRQPPGDLVVVTKDVIVYTDPSPRTLTTTVADTPVSVTVTPISYTWQWGDGTSTTTTDPGAPWPNHTVTHRYTSLAQDVTITLTTTWRATFSVDGGAPQPVSGTVTTTETSTPFELIRLISVLTDDAEEAQGR